MTQTLFISCAKGLEDVLEAELAQLGATELKKAKGGVSTAFDLAFAYRALLWMRSASRMFLTIDAFELDGDESLYQAVKKTDWSAYFDQKQSFAVDCTGRAKGLEHTQYAALKVKDAIVDQLRSRYGWRPNVDTDNPDLRLNLHLQPHRESLLAIDLGGGSLHRRGYRDGRAQAPLRENLAAGLLAIANYRPNEAFVDPLCGSGTFVIEVALMAADVAPGLLRRDGYGSKGWGGHNAELYRELLSEAKTRDKRQTSFDAPLLYGCDIDGSAINTAYASARRAGVSSLVQFETRDAKDLKRLAESGVVATNPPYGERLGETRALEQLYLRLGDMLRTAFYDWRVFILSGNSELTAPLGLKAERRYVVFNGPIECRFLHYPIFQGKKEKAVKNERSDATRLLRDRNAAEMLANRLKKNLKRLKPWLKREKAEAYRIYDADLPEYATAIDRYGDYLLIQEYAPPKSVDEKKAADRLHDTLWVAADVLAIDQDHIVQKTRARQKGKAQYQKHDERQNRFILHEQGLKFWVNLYDYLDTGIFLDHRPVRKMIREIAKNKRFLNLFCYTASVTAYAAAGGAKRSVSVDLSNTYLDWAQDNFTLNKVNTNFHQLVAADVLEWIKRASTKSYDLIFCDPPTFSTSKKMRESFDVQRDHINLLKDIHRLLADDGLLIFSCNLRGFKIADEELKGHYAINDISKKTIPFDFQRNQKIHHCFELKKK